MKFLSFLILILSSLSLINTAQAQMRSKAVEGYIQSNEIIDYSQLDIQCIKDDPNQMEYNYTGEIHTTQLEPNLYKLEILPINFSTPMVTKLISCKVTVLLYIKSDKYLRFVISGSSKPMTVNNLKLIVDNPQGLTIDISKKLSYAKLVPEKTSNGFNLIYYPATALPYSVKHPQN